MKKLTFEDRKDLVDAAMGRIPFDLLINNINVLNVFTNEIYPAEIGIKHGFIAYVEARKDYLGKDSNSDKKVDGGGLLAVPGFIDSHMHIESSMLTPQNFSKIAIPRGTTTIVTDPHEIGNVMGIRGVEYMVESGKSTSMYQYALAPSCVPAAPDFESSGAEFGPEEIEHLLSVDNVLGVAEVMDYYGVINNSKRMREILEVAHRKEVFIQGHLFSKNPRELAAYLCGGPESNHEILDGEDAVAAIRSGMYVDSRDSSFERSIHSIVQNLNQFEHLTNLIICTDDKEPEEIRERGHIDDCVRSAVAAGLPPVEAIKSSTIHTARAYGLKKIGAIAPGYVANINILNDLKSVSVKDVYFEGELVATNNEMLVNRNLDHFAIEDENSVFLNGVTEENLSIKGPIKDGSVNVRVIKHVNLKTSLTEEAIVSVNVVNGFVSLDANPEINFVAIFNRHLDNNNFSVGLIQNFHLNRGAMAATVCHDSHNLALVYTNTADALRAVSEIERIGGGIVYVCGDVVESLELPVAGLMSKLSAEELIPEVERMNRFLSTVGIEADNPVMRLATVSLPVIPSLKITDKGLVDTINQRFVDLFV